jgi:hypothetical protein
MTEFNFKPGDKIRDPNWKRSVFVRIVALGDDTFIGGFITGECLYRKAACDWERFVEPEPAPRKQFIIETEYGASRASATTSSCFTAALPGWVTLGAAQRSTSGPTGWSPRSPRSSRQR